MKTKNGTATTPSLSGVLETALYVNDLDAAEKFYGGVLGLPKIFAVPGRQLVFRCQESIVLVFNPEHTQREQVIINGGVIPFHGTHSVYFRDPAGNSLEFTTPDIWKFEMPTPA